MVPCLETARRGCGCSPAARPAAPLARGGRMPIDKGDTAWVLVCTALVLLMTAPGLALFYGGMVRQKNVVGGVGGALCFSACAFKARLGYDDSLDVVGVHGVGGMWGALGTGLFAWKAINGGGADGLFHGNPGQLWTQFLAVLATMALAAPMTWLILKFVDAVVGIRVSDEDELSGLDLSQHSESAYVLGGPVSAEHMGSASRDDRAAHNEGALVSALGKGLK